MVAVTRGLAELIAAVAQSARADEVEEEALHRLGSLGAVLVRGGLAAAATIAGDGGVIKFAASDQRLSALHSLQFNGGEGPVAESLRRREPRRIDDIAVERRWPSFCRAAAEEGFSSLLALPLNNDREPAGVIALYGQEPRAFHGPAHYIPLLFATQAGMESGALVEQAKAIVHAELAVSPAEAFRMLASFSRSADRRVRETAADLVHGRMAAAKLRSEARAELPSRHG